MGNTMHAHLFKRRQVGQREEVVIKLFYPDGTPCDMDEYAGGGGFDPTGMMRWQGMWTDVDDPHPYGDVVRHNSALWFSLGDAVGEPGVDPLWDRIYPDPV